MNSLWMGNLEPYMDERFISRAFATMGEKVVGVRVIRNKLTGASAGYCFVELTDKASAERCLRKINGKLLPGATPPKRFKLNRATYGRQGESSHLFSLFVSNLTAEVDDGMLYEFFLSRYPSCQGGKVLLDGLGNTRGCGFVQFPNQRDQNRALLECQGARGLGEKPLRLSLAANKTNKNGPSDRESQAQTDNCDDGYSYNHSYNYGYGYSCSQGLFHQLYPNYYSSWPYTVNQSMSTYSSYEQPDSHSVSLPFEDMEDEELEELYDALMACRWQLPDDDLGHECTAPHESSEYTYTVVM
ncbi:riboflavin transporter 2-like [Arapaima gigas]